MLFVDSFRIIFVQIIQTPNKMSSVLVVVWFFDQNKTTGS